MAAMQAQVEPHFLFNTLASIDHLIETDPPRASTMQKNLIALLRASMPTMREANPAAAQPRPRDGGDPALPRDPQGAHGGPPAGRRSTCPTGLLSAEFPPMMIQRLVENAIKHGLEPKAEGGTLRVAAEIVHGKLAVTVADTGLGFGRAATAGTGIGLANIRERLKLLYGDKASMVVADNLPSGTVVTITVPTALQREETAVKPGAAARAAVLTLVAAVRSRWSRCRSTATSPSRRDRCDLRAARSACIAVRVVIARRCADLVASVGSAPGLALACHRGARCDRLSPSVARLAALAPSASPAPIAATSHDDRRHRRRRAPDARAAARALAEVWPELEIVAEAKNGAEAVALAEKHRPDLVFLDIRMPGMTGVDAARAIAQLPVDDDDGETSASGGGPPWQAARSSSSPPTTSTRSRPSSRAWSTTC